MRPTEFYALPTQTTDLWHDAYGSLTLLFDDDSMDIDLDRQAAKEAGANDLAFEQKLFDSGDGERTISYEAVVFKGKPFAILVRSGRGGQDNQSRHITDLPTFEAARSYAERWRAKDFQITRDVVAPDADLQILQGTYGHAVMERNGVTRLVDVDHLDDSGRMLFDDQAFRAAFDRLVRPVFPAHGDAFREGIRGQHLRDLTVPALLEAIPDGVRATDEFEAIPKVEGFTPILGWSPVLVAADDATYALGVPGWSQGYFSWIGSIRAEKVGPPELYDELVRETAPAP